MSSRPKKVSFNISPGPISTKSVKANFCVDLGTLEVSPVVVIDPDREARLVLGSGPAIRERMSGDSENTKEELVRATIAAEEEIRSKSVGGGGEAEDSVFLSSENTVTREELVADSEEELIQVATATEIKLSLPNGGDIGPSKGIRQSSRIKSKGSSSHIMRTRNAKFRGVEGVPGNQMKVTDSVEVEVANVIAIGTAVGFDFSEVEEEVLDEITRRENEDLARFEAFSG